MNEQERNRLLQTIFRLAADTPSPPGARNADPDSNEAHFIEDDELLERWSDDELTDSEHQKVIAHLAHCPDCRGQLALMIKMGALELPEVREETRVTTGEDRPTAVIPIDGASSRKRVLAACVAIATTIVAAVIWFGQTGSSPIALARQDLQEGRAAAAFSRISKYLQDEEAEINDAERKEAAGILEDAGYQVACSGLAAGEFDKVLQINETVTDAGRNSGRLKNLELQAGARIRAETSLTTKGSLSDYDFELDGQNYSKNAFPSWDAEGKKRQREFLDAIESYADEPSLYLNYGQFLLQEGLGSGAAKQFQAALELAPGDVTALTGLGMALFSQNSPDAAQQALPVLQQAHNAASDRLETNLNLAVCLTKLGQADAARPLFQKALDLCQDDTLREKIARVLD